MRSRNSCIGELFEMLFAYQLEGFFLCFPRGLQEALGKQNLALLNKAPQRVVPHFMAARHLFCLLHHRSDLLSFP